MGCEAHRPIADCLGVLSPGGRYVMVGGAIGRVLELLPIKGWLALTRSERQVALLSHEPNRDLGELAALVEQGALTPVIDSVFPLREAPEAMRRFIRGEVCGKAILAIGEPPA